VNASVTLPFWVFALLMVLATWAVIARLLLPSARWFIRRHANRLVQELNERLDLKLPEFKLTRREVLIDRLVYDPSVLEAMQAYSEEEGVPRAVAQAKARRYAREIVPAFSVWMYFAFGSWLARGIVRSLYRVRLGHSDMEALKEHPDASVVFVMNHRSNMDYLLVSYLALDKAALSYAVGEWARVWPLQQVIQTLGAYFVRRGGSDQLYRRVLERYVQMAVAGGVAQAIYPEGGLSRDGSLREPKIGLLDYMLRDFDPDGERDIMFIPVGLNYDRVLEDRTLLLDLDPHERRRAGRRAVWSTFGFLLHSLWLRLRRRWFRYGYACANFGEPLSLKKFISGRGVDLKGMDRESRIMVAQMLAQDLMVRVGRVIPALPVSVACRVVLREPDRIWTREALRAAIRTEMQSLEYAHAAVYVPRDDQEYAAEVGVRMLHLRKMLVEGGDGTLWMKPSERPLLQYYANAIQHF
jgi:glycerol-3-phosphate O-acyltransferase